MRAVLLAFTKALGGPIADVGFGNTRTVGEIALVPASMPVLFAAVVNQAVVAHPNGTLPAARRRAVSAPGFLPGSGRTHTGSACGNGSRREG